MESTQVSAILYFAPPSYSFIHSSTANGAIFITIHPFINDHHSEKKVLQNLPCNAEAPYLRKISKHLFTPPSGDRDSVDIHLWN